MADHCLGCSAIETNPVTLLDGTVVCNSCPAWKQECLARDTEARSILAMPKNDRRGAIDAYARRNGDEAGRRLEATINLLWGFQRK